MDDICISDWICQRIAFYFEKCSVIYTSDIFGRCDTYICCSHKFRYCVHVSPSEVIGNSILTAVISAATSIKHIDWWYWNIILRQVVLKWWVSSADVLHFYFWEWRDICIVWDAKRICKVSASVPLQRVPVLLIDSLVSASLSLN